MKIQKYWVIWVEFRLTIHYKMIIQGYLFISHAV